MEGIMHNATFTAHKTFGSTRNFSAVSAFNWIVECTRVAGQRRALANLSDAALDDIGLTEAQAMREAAKPFWA